MLLFAPAGFPFHYLWYCFSLSLVLLFATTISALRFVLSAAALAINGRSQGIPGAGALNGQVASQRAGPALRRVTAASSSGRGDCRVGAGDFGAEGLLGSVLRCCIGRVRRGAN